MNNQMVQNPKVEVPETEKMNDENNLNCVLENEKNMSHNLETALNEASNETLFQALKTMFDETQLCQRELFELAFSLGWYPLEKAEPKKIKDKCTMLTQKLNQLI